jgi:hypothetical protein
MSALEERLRAVLRAELTDAEKELLGRDAMARVEAALKKRAGAPDGPGTPPYPTAAEEPKDMETLQRQAQQLQPGDVITRHPDHPDRDVWYRVSTWPRRITAASVLIDYTCRPERLDGEACGVLMLDLDQPCQVVPAHTHGGTR